MDIIEKLKQSKLTGRSGSCFPVGLKWELVKKNETEKTYVICNGSEGEPKIYKDKYILQNHAQELVDGIKIALDTFKNSSAYIYLKGPYYALLKNDYEKLVKGLPIEIIEKQGGYIGGEETSICEVIEGRRAQPREKPPFLVENGLWGKPTLVNNVETFYYVSKIAKDEYNGERMYSIEGEAKNRGVFEMDKDISVKEVLEKTKNWPDFDFFVQIGGGAGGKIYLPEELDKPLEGAGGIVIFNKKSTDPYALMREWAEFFVKGNCDKCVPCREGTYRMLEMIKKKDLTGIEDIFFTLSNSSFCSLGRFAPCPFESLINKVIKK